MNDTSLISAGKSLMDYDPLLGSLLVIMMAAIVAMFFWAKSILKEKSEAQLAHLEDVRRFASESEATRSIVSANTEQIRATGEAVVKLADQARNNAEGIARLSDLVRERIRA